MNDLLPTRLWIDVSARIGGDDSDLAFRTAVHLAIYAAQDLCNGPITPTTHPPKALTEELRRGLPLSEERQQELSQGRWPPAPEAFSLNHIPRCVPVTPVKEGTATWVLDDTRLLLTKSNIINGALFTHDVEIVAGPPPKVRQRVKLTGEGGYIPGVPKSLKLMAAVCGLFDGVTRFTPTPFLVDDEEDLEQFLALVEDLDRQQQVIAVAADDGDLDPTWRTDVEAFAKIAFMLQHVAAVTQDGRRLLNEVLGSHGMARGAIKTYHAGFSRLDIPDQHPATSRGAVADHHRGRTGMLRRWWIQLMTNDASERQNDVGP